MEKSKVVVVVVVSAGRVLAIVALLLACWCEAAAAAAQGGEEGASVRESLVGFLTELAGGDEERACSIGWDASVEPCDGNRTVWPGVGCSGARGDGRITAIVLERKGLDGTINAASLCAAAPALRVLSLEGNALRGDLPAAISGCARLTHIYVGENRLSGSLPPSLAELSSLHVLNVSRNSFSGEIPAGLSKLDLVRFCGNDNRFDGAIPEFELSRFEHFSVANNNLTGPIPDDAGDFGRDSFSGNSNGLCGRPNFPACPPSSDENDGKRRRRRARTVVMCLGYVLLGAGVAAFVLYMMCSKRRRRPSGIGGKTAAATATTETSSVTPGKSAYSLPMSEERTNATAAAAATARATPASLVVLQRSGTAASTVMTLNNAAAEAARKLRFEDLLRSPAELLGRGRFGSAYKVVVPGGAALAVKRVKDAAAAAEEEEEFRRRLERVGKARHPAVLPPLAFYCAMQEKLVVYEFLGHGSLAKLLHGSIESSQVTLDWPARLHIAAKVADGMAFMHDALRGGDGDGANVNLSFSSSYEENEEASSFGGGAIAHGNLKASNILFTATMEPCISEYGVTAPPPPPPSALRADVRAYGVLLLELLTGKATAADGAELARWVTAVIREEWTAEVFDRAMLSSSAAAGHAVASEQRMVRLLQVAMRCIDDASSPPPTMREVAGMMNAIREEDDRSLSSEA
uniref:Protein kinase domain-containing protein n=1 Tax=Oryza meridionalis TaxID=40149 RepID=A0A0E0ERP3_9ORYZ